RELHDVERLGTFFDIIHQDPILSQVKLIAEPWDLGEGGYQVGNFPVGWAEWNDKYRRTMRRYWKGDSGTIGDLAYRLTGSSDLYESSGRLPYASVNFVTAHDGFTLEDLVSYNEKHNEANLDDNRDGETHNESWNCGVEGPTSDPEVLRLRRRQKRNVLATLLLSHGIPMLLAGDELGRTQRGNNNAYCQDNELSWLDWRAADHALLEFTARLVHLRRTHPAFRRRRYIRRIDEPMGQSMLWLTPEGKEMSVQDWRNPFARCLGLLLYAEGFLDVDRFGRRIQDEEFLLLLNAHYEPIDFVLPRRGGVWRLLVDTAQEAPMSAGASLADDTRFRLQGRSLALLYLE